MADPIKIISDKAKEICENHGAYLYDILSQKEGQTKVLRIYADTPSGIGIDLCEKISRDLSDFLDKEDLIKDAYSLEVSSPGVERKLRTDDHYKAVIGKKISVSLYSPVDGQKSFTGVLNDFSKNEITLDCITLPKDKISDAHLYFDINEFLKMKD